MLLPHRDALPPLAGAFVGVLDARRGAGWPLRVARTPWAGALQLGGGSRLAHFVTAGPAECGPPWWASWWLPFWCSARAGRTPDRRASSHRRSRADRASVTSSMTDRFAVVGAGQMGNGIAHVCATTGFDVTLIDVSADALAKAKGTIEKNLDRQVKKGALDAGARRMAALARITTATSLDAVEGRPRGGRGSDRAEGAQVPDLPRPRRQGRRRRDPRHQHQLDLDHRDRRGDQAAGAGDRDALHEPRPGHAARRGDPRPRHERRREHADHRALQGPRQGAGGGERLPRVHRQSHPDADDQRGLLRRDGRRGHARGGRPGDEARHEPPDGPADARRLHRPRHLRRDPRGAARRARRPEVPPLPAAQEVRRGRMVRPQVWARILQLRGLPDASSLRRRVPPR